MSEVGPMGAAEPARDLAHRIAVARGDEPADLVLTGGRVLSVFTGELLDVDVAIAGEHVAGLGRYTGREVADVSGLVLLPGFIDGHMHLESTKLMVDSFAAAVLPCGTTAAVIDPHEIANVFGGRGVHALLGAAGGVPFDYFLMVPSCVPAGPFESSGATLDAADVSALLASEPRAIGLAEVMDFPGVVGADGAVLEKILATRRAGLHADGHAPGLCGPALNAYLAAGIRSDHECTRYEEALEKRRLGMWIMIREGSAAQNLAALLPLVRNFGPANCLLCTDDREPDELLESGHVNAILRKAVALGCPPADAVVMATLHPARYHGLTELGAIAPGYLADIVAVPDLTGFRPALVYKRGRLVAADGVAKAITRVAAPDWMRGSVHVRAISAADLRIPAPGGAVRVIEVRPGELVTRMRVVPPPERAGQLAADPSRDLLKAAVLERHHGTGRIGLGLVSGFGLRRGALASTVAHDAHNVVVVGADDFDMAAAIGRLAELGGGQVAVADGRVLAEVPLPLAGLLSDQPAGEVAAQVRRLRAAAAGLGSTLPAPFMTMSFLALSVIPDARLTDRGLLDTVSFALVTLAADRPAGQAGLRGGMDRTAP
ncbi:MAG TPA: adenine deaminase [Streptosporangiaceae bacterium]|nr:adenine deaminase [Streptosporangiaceae bacterium]